MSHDHFAYKAQSYEQNKDRVDNVEHIANAILGHVRLNRTLHIMDFGSGTGLLLERLTPHVGKITAVDVSPAMNAQLRVKQERLACELHIAELDLETASLD